MVKKSHLLVFAIYLVLGVVFLNEPYQIFPSFEITEWIIALAGLLLFIAAFAIVLKFRAPSRYH